MLADLSGFQADLVRRGLSPGTTKEYLRQVAQGSPETRLASRQLSPKYRRLCKSAWQAYARYARDPALAQRLSEVKLPAASRVKPQVPLPEDVYRDLRSAFGRARDFKPATRAALGIAIFRGLRLRRDILQIQRHEIDNALRSGVLAIEAKGGRRLEFGVLETYRRFLVELQQCFAQEPQARFAWQLVSKSEAGARQACIKALKILAHRIDLRGLSADDVRLHVLRRTYSQLFWEKCGKDPVKLKEHMQWQSIVTAMGYADYARREELDLVAASMFD